MSTPTEDTRTHAGEMAVAHDPNSPPLAVQDVTHDAGLPPVDHGAGEAKYGSASSSATC